MVDDVFQLTRLFFILYCPSFDFEFGKPNFQLSPLPIYLPEEYDNILLNQANFTGTPDSRRVVRGPFRVCKRTLAASQNFQYFMTKAACSMLILESLKF